MIRALGNLIYRQPLYYILLFILVGIVIWIFLRKVLEKRLPENKEWKLINIACLFIMVMVIVILTMASRSKTGVEVYLMPFHFIIEARIQPELYRSMLMNVFLFFPLGLTLPYVLPEKWKRKVMTSILFAMIFSIGIEFTQYYFHLGRAETDDVICNTLGCAIGTLSFCLSEKLRKHKNETT